MIRRCRPLLGTFVEISVPEGTPGTSIDTAFAAIAHVHRSMSFHEPESDLARLRQAAQGERVAVDAGTVHVIRIAQQLYRASGGIFDVTIGRALVRGGFLPRLGLPHLNRFTGTMDDIQIVDNTHLRAHRRVLIDLGGIAKGYAVDCAVEALKANGVPHGLVNAGGDLRVFGAPPQTVHIRKGDGRLTTTFTLLNRALASSANTFDRRRYRGQSLSPHIGINRAPVLIDKTISVMASTCVIADAMTKVAMTDPALANRLLAAHDGCVLRDEERHAA